MDDTNAATALTSPAADSFPSDDVREVLAGFGISTARRAIPIDATEEVILLRAEDFARIDATQVALAIMAVVPHTAVAVIAEHPAWQSEPI